MKLLIKITLRVLVVLLLAVTLFFITNFFSRDPDATYELRGRYKPSLDGKTYLIIEDNNGGKCGPLYVDKKVWPHGINVKGKVQPGEHSIECGSWMGVSVKKGTTYYFDYWGP